jgi:hypothetical protein
MEDSVKQRLMKFLRYKDISNSVFEKTCGMANGYVNNIRVGVSPKKLESILLNYPELNRDWLIYGEGDMLNEGYTTFDPVGVATPTAPNLENEITLLKAKLEEKEKMIELLKQQLEELNNLNKGLMTTLTNVATSRTSAKKVAEE